MSLSERLAQIRSASPGTAPCKIGRMLTGTEMPAEDQKILVAELERPRDATSWLTSRTIVSALMAEGYDVSETTVNKHRRGDCTCYLGEAQA